VKTERIKITMTGSETVWPEVPLACKAYSSKGRPGTGLGDMPESWWRKIELRYPNGVLLVLVYETDPGDSEPLPELMWHLQCAAGQGLFEVTIIDPDGTRTTAQAIGPGKDH
jgi:hypothetical protein